ncbi:MAG: beta-ketoacyl synthase N-terminal-like domain-containing protein [Polyangia bacterium]
MSSVSLLPKVAITGLGLVTPLGATRQAFFAGLAEGRSAFSRSVELSSQLPSEQRGQSLWAGCVDDFGAQAHIDAGKRRRMPRLAQMCVVAAREALDLAPGVAPTESAAVRTHGADRVGVVLGTGLGGLSSTIEFVRSFIADGMAAASPAVFPYTVMNASSGLLAIELGLTGPNITVNHRELSLPEAIATGAELIATDRADAVLCGGCDELSPWLVHGLSQLSLLSPDLASAERPPIHPYEARGQGIVPGEGAVVVLLERADRTLSSPALAYLSGVGRAGDHRARVGWSAAGAASSEAGAAITESLQAAGLTADQIDYVAGAGNGSSLDEMETSALRQALGPAAEHVAISSVIGQCGEWQTSAGVRLGAALWSLCAQKVPGTVHCEAPDPGRSLPGLVLSPRDALVRHVLLPTLSQGGANVSLVLRKA